MRLEINNSIINLKNVEMLINYSLLCVDFNNNKYILEFLYERFCKEAYTNLLNNGVIESWRYDNISIST